MPRLVVFNQITLDGYFTGKDGDLSWAHKSADPEWNAFVAGNASSGGTLLFGRVTYEMMVSYWPTPAAMKDHPAVAKGMNDARKIVFSKTLKDPAWNNTTVVSGDIEAEVLRLKAGDGHQMTILGSGTIVTQLTKAGLVDEYQLIVNPTALGAGRTLFDGLDHPLALTRTHSRTFGNGNVLLTYERAG